MSACLDGLPKQQRLAGARWQQTSEHLHRRRLAASVRAKKTKDLAAIDAEIDIVDGREVAEAAGKITGYNDGRAIGRRTLWNDEGCAAATKLARKQCNEGVLQARSSGFSLEFLRRAGRDDFAGIHRDKPIEALGLLHIGGCGQEAHARVPFPDPFGQFPELPARQRIDASRRLVENKKRRIMDESATEPKLLPHAAGELPGLPIDERLQTRALGQFLDATLRAPLSPARTVGQKRQYSRRR